MSSEDKKKYITLFLGKLLSALEKNKVDAIMQVTEAKMKCQPPYRYRDKDKSPVTVLVDTGL